MFGFMLICLKFVFLEFVSSYHLALDVSNSGFFRDFSKVPMKLPLSSAA